MKKDAFTKAVAMPKDRKKAAVEYFAKLEEAIKAKRWKNAQSWLDKIERLEPVVLEPFGSYHGVLYDDFDGVAFYLDHDMGDETYTLPFLEDLRKALFVYGEFAPDAEKMNPNYDEADPLFVQVRELRSLWRFLDDVEGSPQKGWEKFGNAPLVAKQAAEQLLEYALQS